MMNAQGGCGWPLSDPSGTSPQAQWPWLRWQGCFCSKHLALLTHFPQKDTAYLV